MSVTAGISIGFGVFFGAAALLLQLRPALACDALKKFPRHQATGQILAAIALLWSAWLLWSTHLQSLEKYKNMLCLITLAGFVPVTIYMNELLAPRALGGILLLNKVS